MVKMCRYDVAGDVSVNHQVSEVTEVRASTQTSRPSTKRSSLGSRTSPPLVSSPSSAYRPFHLPKTIHPTNPSLPPLPRVNRGHPISTPLMASRGNCSRTDNRRLVWEFAG